MRFLVSLVCAAALFASEADPRAQARATWSEALKAGDAWTCLQLEAWARGRKPAYKLGAALGGSTVSGEVLFALPDTVANVFDAGDRIVMTTYQRAYVVAPDGRPLQASVQLTPEWGRQAAGYGAQAVGACRRRHGDAPGERRIVELGSTVIADGSHPVSQTIPLGPTQRWDQDMAVADDGSAVVTVIISDSDAPNGRNDRSMVVATDKVRIVEDCREPFGVGRRAAWLLARNADGVLLVRGDQRQTVTAGAPGPGLAACVRGGKALLIGIDGKEQPLTGAPALGDAADVITVGTWLVMGSGYGAKIVSEGDLLGENAGEVTEQPPTLAFWRWSDLQTNPTAKPVTTMPGELSQATQYAAAVWLWKGSAIDVIDLSGAEPVRSHYMDVRDPIRWVSTNQHCLRVEYEKPRRFELYGPDKAELWSGECVGIEVKRRDLALSEHRGKDDRHEWRLQWLDATPGKRRSVPLQLPPEDQRLNVSVSAPDMVIARGDMGEWRQANFAGKVIDAANERGPQGVDRPSCPEWSWFMATGRYYREGAHVYEKSMGPPEDIMSRLSLLDAWRVSGSTVLLNGDGRVLISGRRRGEWIEAGIAPGGSRLALSGNQPAVMRGDESKPIALLVPGPKLVEARDRTPDAIDFPAGPWRLERGRFTPPRGRQYEWDDQRVGWGGVHLRSPDGSGLFIITPSALIELDPDAARFFGK
jgi:hypothetical protein